MKFKDWLKDQYEPFEDWFITYYSSIDAIFRNNDITKYMYNNLTPYKIIDNKDCLEYIYKINDRYFSFYVLNSIYNNELYYTIIKEIFI